MTIVDNIVTALKQQNKKTFELNEIISLINNVIYRIELPDIESEGIVLSSIKHEVIVKGEKINVPKKVFELLYYFISNKNKVILRKDILRDIWGTDVYVLDKTIDVHIRKIREIVGLDNLRTIKGVGYGWYENN